MKVYVLTYGQETYEDNVVVAGVFKKEADAIEIGKQETPISKDDASWGAYWYDVQEYTLE